MTGILPWPDVPWFRVYADALSDRGDPRGEEIATAAAELRATDSEEVGVAFLSHVAMYGLQPGLIQAKRYYHGVRDSTRGQSCIFRLGYEVSFSDGRISDVSRRDLGSSSIPPVWGAFAAGKRIHWIPESVR